MTDEIQSVTMTDIEVEPDGPPEPIQFTADYWSKAPRKLMDPVTVIGINTKDGNKEFVLANGARLLRPVADIKQLITPGTPVAVQIIQTVKGQIVTGLFLPQVQAWAWQMSAQDLADYAREVDEAVRNQQMQVRLEMTLHIKTAMLPVLNGQPRFQKLGEEDKDKLAEELAVAAVIALEMA